MIPKEIIEGVLTNTGKFIIPTDFTMHGYDADYRVPIIFRCPFLETGGAHIDVREGTLILILNNENVVFKVFEVLNMPSYYMYLWMITSMELNKYGVVKCKPLMTLSDSLTKSSQPTMKPKIIKF